MLPIADCWIFGFPCQDISIAGKQLGFSGNRSSLYFEVMRLLHEIEEENRPEWLLAENVKNFLSVNNGWDFLAAQIAMDEAGYDCQWYLLNSKDFGVPQNRERVFLIGHSRRYSRRFIFLEQGNDDKAYGLQGQTAYSNTITRRYAEAQSGGTYIIESEQQKKIDAMYTVDLKDRKSVV